MKLFKQNDCLRTIFYLEIILIFSILASLLIYVVMRMGPGMTEGGEAAGNTHWRENYRTLKFFLNYPKNDRTTADKTETGEPALEPPGVAHPPFTQAILELESAERLLEEKKYREIPGLLKDVDSANGYIAQKKNKIYLKYLYSRGQFTSLIRRFDLQPTADTDIQLSVMSSLAKTGRTERAFAGFRELFKRKPLSPFRKKLPGKHLVSFLRKLDYPYWFAKFSYLAARGQFSEMFREQKYCPFPPLIYFFNAEYNYRRGRYRRTRYWLNRIGSKELENHKKKLLIKIKIREENYQDILPEIESLKDDPDVYPPLLLDSGGLLTVKGEYRLALELFSRYTALSRTRDKSHWRILWLSGWIRYRLAGKDRALRYFEEGKNAPIPSYRLANEYWWCRLKDLPPPTVIQSPFSYYYCKLLGDSGSNPSVSLNRDALLPFKQLVGGKPGPRFRETVDCLRLLLEAGLSEEAPEFIEWALGEEKLSSGEETLLKIIESILYLNRGKYQKAFFTFSKYFPHYRQILPPRFLGSLYLPVKYQPLTRKYARINRLDPFLVLALIRNESFFQADAVSGARANGLMQLLLGTARDLYRPTGGKKRLSRWDLYKPGINIPLGCRYLRRLVDRYDGKIHLALAAYNAGEHRVDRWLREFGPVEDDEFIEMIPFTETRGYVKSILRNHFYYRYYYGR